MLSPFVLRIFLFNHCHICSEQLRWGQKYTTRSAAAKLSSLEFVGWVGWVAMQRMHSMSMYVCVTYWCGQRIGSAKIKGQHAAALHLIHRAAHTEQSAQRSFCFSTDARIRMYMCCERESQLHRHTFIDASLAVQTHKYTNMQTHLVDSWLHLLSWDGARDEFLGILQLHICALVEFFCLLWSAVADTQSNKESVYSYNSFV
jgi:hypothetical protein